MKKNFFSNIHYTFLVEPGSVAIYNRQFFSSIRYMQNNVTAVSRNTLQLVGVAAMLVASKYEEIYAPEVLFHVFLPSVACKVYC